MKIYETKFVSAASNKRLQNAVRIALVAGMAMGMTGQAFAQFGPRTMGPENVFIPSGSTGPSFVEERDTTDLVADQVRAAGTNFLNQENLALTADVELDFDGSDTDGGDDNEPTYDAGGRVRLTMQGNHTAGDRYFTGRAEALFKEDGNAAVDDAWFAFGDATWDLQLGRFEAINLFPLGLDTFVLFAGDGSARNYQLNFVRGRIGGSGGQIAGRVRFSPAFRAEVDTIWGDPDDSGDNTDTIGGVRPSVTFETGPFSASVGAEYVSFDLEGGGEIDRWGYGGTLRYNDGPILAHLNAAYLDDDESSTPGDVTTLGANLIYDGRLGLGVIYSTTDPDNSDLDPELTTVYAAYVVPIFGFDRAKVTFGASYSTSDDAGDNDTSYGGRVRFNYAF